MAVKGAPRRQGSTQMRKGRDCRRCDRSLECICVCLGKQVLQEASGQVQSLHREEPHKTVELFSSLKEQRPCTGNQCEKGGKSGTH